MKNMRFNKWIIGLVAAVGMATVAAAQEFPAQTLRTLVLSPMQQIIGGTAGIVTNGPQDKLGAIGQGYIDIFSSTNSSTNIMTAQIFTSPDTTNLTALANYGLISSTTSIIITNTLYGSYTNLIATNNVLLPGTYTTPTPATAGYATPYLAQIPFTNTGAVTITGKGTYRVIIPQIQDQNRYFYIIYTPSGLGTNMNVGANLTFPIMRQ